MNKTTICMCAMMLALPLVSGIGRFAGAPASLAEDILHTPERVVNEFFDSISFEAGTTPDWERMKALFIEEAVIVYRLGPNTMRTFRRQGFVDYLVMDIQRANLPSSGLRKTIVKKNTRIIKDIAQVYVLHEVVIPGINDDRPVNRGVDSFHLIRQDGRWWIASLMNEGFSMDEAIPGFLNE